MSSSGLSWSSSDLGIGYGATPVGNHVPKHQKYVKSWPFGQLLKGVGLLHTFGVQILLLATL